MQTHVDAAIQHLAAGDAEERLFANPPVMDNPGKKQPRRKVEMNRYLNVTPNTIIIIFPDGTGGAEAPKEAADMASVDDLARKTLSELQRRCTFIGTWLDLPKAPTVDVR